MKRPAFQFYPGDWQHDSALRSCSVAARGLWMEMICLMHQAEPYGHLVVNGKGLPPDALARMVGCSPAECKKWLAELEGAGVFNHENGVVISRRMVRDERTRRLRAEGGKLGGNPNLTGNHKTGTKVEGKVNHHDNLPPTPSSSSSSSLSSKEADPPARPVEILSLPGMPPADLWGIGIKALEPVMPEPKARAFIGSLLRDYADDTVRDALLEADGSVDPRAYVRGILKGKACKPNAKDEDARYREGMRGAL